MTWTREKPNKPGWYWWRSRYSTPHIYELSYLPADREIPPSSDRPAQCLWISYPLDQEGDWQSIPNGGEWSSDAIMQPEEPTA